MIFKLKLTAQAKKQYKEIVDWYSERSQQATDNFIRELDETFNKICRNPFSYRSVHQRFRILKMKTYPYYIIFSIEEKSQLIVIAKLYHTARNPEKKYRHLNDE
jgi:plasmid stabilization system protein ParE